MTTRRWVLLTAEIALTALTVLATISMERLFSDATFLRELLVMAVGAHVVAALCRRAELSMLWATPVSALALVVLGTAVFYPEVSALVVPTSETLTALGDDLRTAWQTFSDDAAPVPPLRGFIVAASVLVWYGVFLADWAAFRLRSPLEAVVPATAIFVFAALLGVHRNEIAHGVLLAIGLLVALVTLRAERQSREEVWIAGRDADGVRTTLRFGSAAGGVAVLVAAILAPQLPGATAEPLVDITDFQTGPNTREVPSPLVEISASLVNQTDTELFSVTVDREDRDYWRLMALTTFENDIWRRRSNFDDARGPVDRTVDARVATRSVVQEISIAALGNIYLPAAYEVSNVIDSAEVGLQYEAATGALVVERGFDEIPAGLDYVIESQVPDYVAADLPADAAAGLDGDFVREHTQLPRECESEAEARIADCWPPSLTAEARRIVGDAGATTDYERVLALQSFFLDQFTYNIQVALEHDIVDMTTFLEIREGYCEQFAATFAAMARALGIPARVAVGFTWGDWDEERGEYVVRGKHAHAWPEVYFAGVGWLIFEPTPGRSRGFDSDITGLSTPQQAGAEDAVPATATTTPVDPREDEPVDAGGPAQPVRPVETETTTEVGDPASTVTEPSGRALTLLIAAVALVAAVVAFVPATQLVRRRRRMARIASDPVGRGELAWDDALGALRLLGLHPRPGQTPLEFATQVEAVRRDIGPLRRLATEVTSLRFSPAADRVAHAVAAQTAAAEIVALVRAEVGPRRLLGDSLDPRALLRPPPASRFAR